MMLKGNRNEPRCASFTFAVVAVDDEEEDGSVVVILLCQSTVNVEGTMAVRGVVVRQCC